MGTDDSELTPPRGTPKSVPFIGALPSTPPPKPHIIPGARISTPPPIPNATKRPSISPPPLSNAASRIIPPPLPASEVDEGQEPTNPRIKTSEQQKMLELLRSFYPEDQPRLDMNGNALPVLHLHLKDQNDALLLEIEGNTKFLFRFIPVKYAVIGATILTLAAAGLAAHSCSETKKLEQRIEQLEKQKSPNKTSHLPRYLRNPPGKPLQKVLSQRKLLKRRA